MREVQSELEFIKGIATNIVRDIDEMEGAFSKSQRTRTTERNMESLRERARVMFDCANDAIKALDKAAPVSPDLDLLKEAVGLLRDIAAVAPPHKSAMLDEALVGTITAGEARKARAFLSKVEERG